MKKRKIIDTHSHLACKMFGNQKEGAGHMFRYKPEPDLPIPEMEKFDNVDYYEIYTRGMFCGERMWPDDLWEKAQRDPDLKTAMSAADMKWMGNRCLKNTFWNVQRILDENQVDFMCILPLWPANSFEDYLAAARLEPRFLPFTCIYNTELDVDEAIEKLMQDVDQGARGLKIHPIIQNLDLKSDYVKKILMAWSKTDLPVISHCGNVEYGTQNQGTPNYGNPEFLADLVEEMPDVKFVGAHCGGCRSWEARYFAERVGKRENLWVDTSFRSSEEIQWMVDSFGEDKVLFGVDVPFSDMDVSIACVEECQLSEEVKEKIFWSNAFDLLKLGSLCYT